MFGVRALLLAIAIAIGWLVVSRRTDAIDRPAVQAPAGAPARPTLEHGPPPMGPSTLPGVPLHSAPHLLSVPHKARVVVVAPHPDDETLGAGGLIQRLIEQGGTVEVLFVTNGDGYRNGVVAETRRPNLSRRDFLAYGEHRRREALRALAELAPKPAASQFLGFPDDGIDDLWADNWPETRPYRSPFTDSDRPPYEGSPRQDIEYSGVDLRRELRRFLQQFGPDLVVIPDPRDQHPDHCTTGGFVLDALRELREAQIAPFTRTEVLTYLVHYPEYPGDPSWQTRINHAGIGGSAAAQENLSHTAWLQLDLTRQEVVRKQHALRRYRSQMRVMDHFLGLFVRPVEMFGHLSGTQIVTIPREYATRWRPHHLP